MSICCELMIFCELGLMSFPQGVRLSDNLVFYYLFPKTKIKKIVNLIFFCLFFRNNNFSKASVRLLRPLILSLLLYNLEIIRRNIQVCTVQGKYTINNCVKQGRKFISV